MESKHTPGPWIYPEDGTKAPDLAIFSSVKPRGASSEHGACVAHVMLSDPITGFLPKGQHAANARLIAAAPELLNSLRSLLDTVERLDIREGVCCCGDSMESHSNPMDCGHSPVDAGEYYHGQTIENARKAILKAEGFLP